MRVRKQFWTVLALGSLATAWGAAPAFAAVPGNDTAAGATVVTALPFSETVDTTEATTDTDDSALNASCGAPVTNGSIWYAYTSPATGVDGIVVDVSQSSFSAGAIIAQDNGSGGWDVVACGPGATGTAVLPETAYRILAFSDTAGVTGGQLAISITAATIPTISLTVSPKGKVDRYGNALISGTVTCTEGNFVDLGTSLRQAVGRFAIVGDGYTFDSCTGGEQPWSVTVVPSNGKFAGGKAASFTWGFTCGAAFCAEGYAEQLIRLSR